MRKGPEIHPAAFVVLVLVVLAVAGAWLWRSSDRQATPQLTTAEYKRRFEKAMGGYKIGGPPQVQRASPK